MKLKALLEQSPVLRGASRLTDTQEEDVISIPHNKVTSELSKAGAKDWTVETKKGVYQIKTIRKFDDYKKTMKFVNDVAKISEKLDHHPDIFFNYDTVTIEIYSHSHNGITSKDIEFAKDGQRLRSICNHSYNFSKPTSSETT